MSGRLRWKRKPAPRGLIRMVTPPMHLYTDGTTTYATVQRQYSPGRAWFWCGMGENTADRPVATVDEAKAEAQAHVRAALASATPTTTGKD